MEGQARGQRRSVRHHRLGRPRDALEQDVAAGQESDEEAVDGGVVPHHRLPDLRSERRGQCGRGVREHWGAHSRTMTKYLAYCENRSGLTIATDRKPSTLSRV